MGETVQRNAETRQGLDSVRRVEFDGIVLTPLEPTDAEEVYGAASDPEISKWLPWAVEGYSIEDAKVFVGAASDAAWESGRPVWAIREKGDDKLAGVVTLRNMKDNTWDIGFWMTKDKRGKGIATRATKAALKAGFEHLGALRVQHLATIGNYASQSVARKTGFLPEGTIRKQYDDGSVKDQWQSAILKADWYAMGLQALDPTRPEALRGSQPAELVSEFHRAYEMPNRVADGATPTLDFDRLHMRMALIKEEMTELITAVLGEDAGSRLHQAFEELPDSGERDLPETADALADLIYVIYGMALESGIDLDEVLKEVHSANLSKLMPDGSVRRREDGKILKGPNFREPDIEAVLARLGDKPQFEHNEK